LARIKDHSEKQELVRVAITARRDQEKAEKERTELAVEAVAAETRAIKQKEEDALKAEWKVKEEILRRVAVTKLEELEKAKAAIVIDDTWDEEKKEEVADEWVTKTKHIQTDLVLFLLDQPT
jgi:hypothetical protein